MNSLTRLYSLLLLLYPRRFRESFGDEMLAVFEEALAAAAVRGRLAGAGLFLEELLNLPAAVLHQHNLERRRTSRESHAAALTMERPSAWETCLTLAVFALPAALIYLKPAQPVSSSLLPTVISALLVIAFLAGFRRWSLPYLGLALSAFSFLLVFQRTADELTPLIMAQFGPVPATESISLLLQAFWAGMMWLCLFVLLFVIAGILYLLGKFQVLFARFQQDWTLASFTLYSGAIVALLLAFDRYHYAESYTLTSTLCLAGGACLYLHSRSTWQRLLALLAGITLAMGSIALGQNPPLDGRLNPFDPTLLEWGWMVLVIVAPALLKLLPTTVPRDLASL
jgi:hypothetical protein